MRLALFIVGGEPFTTDDSSWTITFQVLELLIAKSSGNNDFATLNSYDLYRISRIL